MSGTTLDSLVMGDPKQVQAANSASENCPAATVANRVADSSSLSRKSRPQKHTHKKVRTLRRNDFAGSRWQIPAVRKLNRDLREQLEREEMIVHAIIRDAHDRAAIARGHGIPFDPLSVYRDFDHLYHPTELNPLHLPTWDDTTEYLKAQMGFQVGLCFGAYSFTANIHPDMEERWTIGGCDPAEVIRKRLNAELGRAHLRDLPIFYVTEGRSRTHKSRTKLHVHGYFLADDPIIASRMTDVLLRTFRRKKDGTIDLSRTGVKIEPGYDVDDPTWGPGRWVRYSAKNALRRDKRLPGRRTFMNHALIEIVREFWLYLREEPFSARPQRARRVLPLNRVLKSLAAGIR